MIKYTHNCNWDNIIHQLQNVRNIRFTIQHQVSALFIVGYDRFGKNNISIIPSPKEEFLNNTLLFSKIPVLLITDKLYKFLSSKKYRYKQIDLIYNAKVEYKEYENIYCTIEPNTKSSKK